MESISSFFSTAIFTLEGDNSITIGDIALILLLFLGSYLLIQLLQLFIKRRLAASQLGSDAVVAIRRVSFYIILTLVSLTALSILGIPIGVFAFATGAIAIGVGFGAQNIINNFISGWILMAERPIRIDDFIEIEGVYGSIEEVGTRSTRIRRSDGVHMLVPNSKLLENTVVNWTLIDKHIRSSVRVGVAYGSDVKLVAALLEQIVKAHPQVLKEPHPEFVFEDFGDSALIFDAFFWCDVSGEKSLRAIRSEMRFQISELFEENNIVIAFPQRDLHLHTAKPIEVSVKP